ncbi:hypothetical protein BJ875DRAFT_443302 [Amylocarpus encephaloides]|uniref:Uncharacterized protein n=1 Tax=Amylocarpus encephaloides TaxID=45428 RepID=A0A9P7YFV8_9HELO|nr:hypothetical protein BJ875DRAFT_443302 [Amylocarpus encephaloides]
MTWSSSNFEEGYYRDELAKDAAVIKPREMNPLAPAKTSKQVPKEDQSPTAFGSKQSETSMKVEQETPSIFSGASKASSKRRGFLMSNEYQFASPLVGLSAMAVPLEAIPLQSGSLVSQERNHGPTSDDDTLQKSPSRISHTIRRAIFAPDSRFVLILIANQRGFLSNLTMPECHGILRETLDSLGPALGMAGRARGSSGDKAKGKSTNHSSFPRVASAFAITRSFGHLFSAISIGVGGSGTRQLGRQAATGVMAGVFTHSFRSASEGVDSIPKCTIHSRQRMNVLEMGSLTRFSDANSLGANHPNMIVLGDVEERPEGKKQESSAREEALNRRTSHRSDRDPDDELTSTGQDPRHGREGSCAVAGGKRKAPGEGPPEERDVFGA